MKKERKDIYAATPVKCLVNFLTKEVEINSKNIADYERPIKLKRMVDIYDSSLSLYSKIYEMSLIYTPAQFALAIRAFNKFRDDLILGEFVGKLNEIADIYKNCANNGILKDVTNLMKIENYFYSYDYAKFLISSYITYSDSFYTEKFLVDYGVDKSVFDYCLNVVGELDPELYRKYEKKYLENKKGRIEENTLNLNNIVNGVKTGYTLNGEVFDTEQFLKCVPFWNLGSSREVLDDFGAKGGADFSIRIRSLIKEVMPEYYHEIINFMNENKIDTYSFQPLKEKDVYDIKLTVNGREVTAEDKDIIMNYIVENNLPMVIKSYEVVRNKYLSGEITKDSVRKKEYVTVERNVLIP